MNGEQTEIWKHALMDVLVCVRVSTIYSAAAAAVAAQIRMRWKDYSERLVSEDLKTTFTD